MRPSDIMARMLSGFRTWAFHALAAAAVVAPPCVSLAQADALGLVLIHGKHGGPAQFQRLAEAFNQAGWLTEQPEMCWSRRRNYDRPYLDCLEDIDGAIGQLRSRGAGKIVPIGMSLGGNAVLAYGARHDRLAGIIALAPAHAPELISLRPDISASLQRARTMVAEGHGDVTGEFADVNTGDTSVVTYTVKTTAKIYVSFFAPESPGMMPANAAQLKAPLLLISGTADPTQRGARIIFGNVPPRPMNLFVSVDAAHRGTPAAGRAAMFSWLNNLVGK
jgi:pimeloyl-ACP methyl ester carboxylesterase